ncbi:MAG TPA: hypothetical protein VIM55_10140 [Mucilaginibacter sp.]
MKIVKPLALIMVLFLLSGCKVYYMGLRGRQLIPVSDTATVTRVYFDRYGDLYPGTAVPIDTNDLHIRLKSKDKKQASLKQYFLTHPASMKALREFYHASAGMNDPEAYQEVQGRLEEQAVKQVSDMVQAQQAGRLVYLVHGLNDTRVDPEYKEMRKIITDRHYAADKKPVYVEIHWDSMNARDTDGTKVIDIWKPALLNSRFISIAFRKLMTGVEQRVQVPEIVITHSLGAGLAFGALFNTVTKWKGFDLVWPEWDKEQLNALNLAPTPTGRIRIGVLAPAVPAEQTFQDFNERGPRRINAADNHIDKVVIGYNRQDYAVSKQFLHIKLAGVYGSTSLGCNCNVFNEQVIPSVLADLAHKGYTDPSSLIIQKEFKTPPRPNPPFYESGTTQHAWKFYMAQQEIQFFLDQLFQ